MQHATRHNVAPTSTEGHFVTGANVVDLDASNETFLVEGPSRLETANHTTLAQDEACLITCQVVLDPMTGYYERSRD